MVPDQSQIDSCVLENSRLAWAAGFFDGEGSTVISRVRNDSPRLRIMVTQHGHGGVPDTLQTFADTAGYGRIYGPYQYRGYRTPRYYWYADNAYAWQILRKLWPYLHSAKREQASRAIAVMNEHKIPIG